MTSLPAFKPGPPPRPDEPRYQEWETEFWRWVRQFWSASVDDITDLEARVLSLETDVGEIMSVIKEMNSSVSALLKEAQITNRYLYELPRQLNEGTNNPGSDDPNKLREETLDKEIL